MNLVIIFLLVIAIFLLLAWRAVLEIRIEENRNKLRYDKRNRSNKKRS